MSGQRCKAAIDCVGFICQIQNSVDLIVGEQINDPEAIDAFNEMKEECQKAFDKWVDDYIEF